MIRTVTTLILLFIAASALSQETISRDAKVREFAFRYEAALSDIPAGASVRVWVPIAKTNTQQQISISNIQLPNVSKFETNLDRKYGNKILYFELESAGKDAAFSIDYTATRHEARFDKGERELSKVQRNLFLAANQNVPLSGKPAQLIAGKTFSNETTKAGRELYDFVDSYMKYDKSKPGYGRGDVLWACDSKTGNCTDFHSLFISLARQNKIPARFEIGFPLPSGSSEGKIKGYHCWAWFFSKGDGWIPVDISEADKHPEMRDYYFGNLTADRIAFSTGRDIELDPAPSSPKPLNYFVFPFVEVDGKVWPKEKIKLDFSFAEVDKAKSELR